MLFAKRILLSDILYSAWANQCLLDACSALTAEERERDLRISHANILATLRHIHDGERVWLDCLRTPDLESWWLPQGPVPQPSFAELRESWPELSDGYHRWLEELSEDGLETELTVQMPGEAQPRIPRWKILRHVLEHSTLHRGQIVGMIRMLGHTPPGIHRMDFYQAGKP